VNNAIAAKKVIAEHGSLHSYFSIFLRGIDVHDEAVTQAYGTVVLLLYAFVRVSSPASIALSKDMKKRGFNFVGPTVMQAFLQASGLYKAHDSGCFKHIRKR
jgi:DNA-3-methyladenine glycosylase I